MFGLDLSPEVTKVLLVVAYLIGVSLRVFWPYLLAYLQDGVKFDWKFVVGQLIGAVIGLFGVMSGAEFLGDLGTLGFFGAMVAGFGAAAIGRESQKSVDAARK